MTTLEWITFGLQAMVLLAAPFVIYMAVREVRYYLRTK